MDNEYRAKLAQKYHEDRIGASEIPPEYMVYTLSGENNSPIYDITNGSGEVANSKVTALQTTIKYITNINHCKKEGKGVYFYGHANQKLGMSLLGTYILRAAIDCGYSALFVPFPSMCEDLDYAHYNRGESEIKDRYYEVDFLMIDSLSDRNNKSTKVCDALADIILERRRSKKPTIFSAYIDPITFTNYYGQSIASYLQDFIEVVKIENDITGVKTVYRIESLKHFFDRKQKEYGRDFLTGEEIDDIIKLFKSQVKTVK
jgi:DNA replication protein DnaC